MRTPAVVMIFGGETIVGQTLALLLRCAGYNATFVAKPTLEEPGLLDGVRLLILAPRLDAERREAILAAVGSMTAGTRIPVLELVDDPEEAGASSNHLIPWPCRIQDLKRHIEATLRTGLTQPGHR